MRNVTSYKTRWTLPALLAMALLFALGCSTGSQPAQSSALASGSQPSPQVGNQVGNQVIPFTLRLADGSLVTSAELASQNRPTFMLFFKVPWGTCGVELRRLKEIYPEYADKVALYAVSYDTFQDMSKLVEHSQEEGWIWPVAYPVGTMLRDYEVIIYSNKIAFDSRGVITYRSGPGEGTDEDFRRAFQTLAASR